MSARAAAPALSIIIPTCGRAPMLLDCVASILRNDFGDFEIIIIDQDRDQRLRAELDRRFGGDRRLIYLVMSEPHASRARNLGIRHARGSILVFSDDDVEVEADWLRSYVEAFASCAETPAVVGGRLDPMWLAPRPDWLPEAKEYLLGIYNKHDRLMPMPEHDQPIGANFATHRAVMDAVGPFDERLGPSYSRKRGLIYGEDALFALRARQAKYPVYHQAGARSWHKMTASKLTRGYFLKRSFWEGVTLLCVLHLAGTIPAARWHRVVLWHLRDAGRSTGRLAATLLYWPWLTKPQQRVMEAMSSIAHSAGVIRAALKLRATGQLPW